MQLGSAGMVYQMPCYSLGVTWEADSARAAPVSLQQHPPFTLTLLWFR